ncbi:MAG TPA: T9SS type A sorting domain-containing protein, partial [Flavisolibacter sp.]|nr:T9SS type A sorting domain-containing protein [Flavisolibacter sp.]
KTCVGGNGVNNGSYGHPTIANGNQNFLVYVLRKEAADPRLKASAAINQQLGGVFFSFADLGIAAGQTIYGYSLIGPDGIANPTSAQVLNINDPTVYPTNTTEAQGGGLDLIAVNALFISGPVLAATSSNLNATVNQHTVNLNWIINGIDSSSVIKLERSQDGTNFETIYSQVSNGNSAQDVFNDKRSDGNYYYRLKITIEDKIYYSEIVKVTVGSLNHVRLYPNVVSKGSSIIVDGLKPHLYNAQIVSSDGKMYTVSNLNGSSSIKLSLPYYLTSGVYFIYFTDAANNHSNVSRLVIQ